MTHHLFGSVRVPSTVNQQDETITPATKANCHDNRSSALRCYPERTPHTPHHPNPLSQYAKETRSQPKYNQWFNHEAAESHRNAKPPKYAHSYLQTWSSDIVSSSNEISANGLKIHSRDTERVCIGFVRVRVGRGGWHICLTMCAGKCFA